MLEELKYALFNIDDYNLYRNYDQKANTLKFIYKDVIVYGTDKNISVFYDANDTQTMIELKYINKSNSLKTFDKVSSAINYMRYLSNITTDPRYELYYYFIYKLKVEEVSFNVMSFGLTNNTSTDSFLIRCDIGGLKIRGNKVNYNFVIVFKSNYKCELQFYPERPLWNEGKICPESDIDKVLVYILNLNVNNYEDILLKES